MVFGFWRVLSFGWCSKVLGFGRCSLVQGARLLLGAWYVEFWNLAMVSLQLPPNFQGETYLFKSQQQLVYTWPKFDGIIVATLALGSRPRQGVARLPAKRGAPEVMLHALGSVRECEGIDLHTPKGTPTLGVKVLMDSWIFRGRLQGSKLDGLRSSLYCWKSLGL